MSRIASVMVMHVRDRMSWFLIPASILGAGFVIVLFIALSIDLLWGDTTPVYTGALAVFYFVMLIEAIRTVSGTFPFAVGFGTRRRDYLLGTLAWGVAFCAAWAILLGLLSLIEANVIKNWGVNLHFFHLPVFSDGSPLRQFCWGNTQCAQSDPNYFSGGSSLQQFWVSFVLLLFMYLLGLLLGSIYQRFGRTGEFILFGIAFLLLTFLDTAHRLGLTPAQTQRLSAPPDLIVVQTQQSQATRPVSEIAAGFVLAYASAILIYISIGAYTGIVAAGVAEEKSSRMMEILVNAATPFQLLAGKIVGIGAACLTQMGCVVVVGIAALLLQTPLQAALFGANAGGFSQYLTGVSIPFYLLFLLYFLLGFFLYATLYAGLAAMVKRQEEVQSAIMLPQMLMVSSYLLFFLAAFTPDATLTKVLSYLPFWTPWVMLPRIARGTVAWWEIVVTIALMLGAILACTWFAARIYRFGVLMYGQRPGLGQLVKLVRMN